MLPAFLDDMSWEMAEVYGAITDQIMINLAHYFPFYDANDPLPSSAFEYQASMLAQMGKVNADTMRIIKNGLSDADPALKRTLEQAVISSVRKAEPELLKGVQQGILKPAGMPIVAPGQMRAFQLYYQQAAEKLNLVNTVMLESTQSAYQQAVSDVVADMELSERMYHTQLALDTAAGETVTGVSSWNQSLRHAMDKLKDRGITGFVDHAGRHWSAEAYVAMDIRTTVANTARSAVWETNQNFGNDLYSVSSHNGARPLCYPWQNKVISSTDNVRKVQDLDGNEILVVAQSETSYGEPAGLFGINCKHMADPFIPGVSVLTGHPQDEEENTQTYEESQEQRRLERKIREQKRDVLMAKAQGADDEEIRKLREKAGKTSEEIDEFCKKTGRARHRDREGVYTKREFPDKEKYDVTQFENEQKKRIEEYYRSGGAQQGYTFGQMTPKQPIVSNVASQATPEDKNAVQSNVEVFKPARTRAEAEAYAREHFANTVTYNGSMTVDVMNTVNSELKELTDAYPIDKLRKIEQNGRMNALARANGGGLEVNGKSIHEETGFAYSMRQDRARKNLELLNNRYPEGIPSVYRKDVKQYEEILKYSRWTIDDNLPSELKVRATIAHEYGHILADQRCGQINNSHFCKTFSTPEAAAKRKLIEDTYRKAKQTGDIYLLSEYGGSNSHEFFAETFSAYWTKQELPEYFYDMIRGVV